MDDDYLFFLFVPWQIGIPILIIIGAIWVFTPSQSFKDDCQIEGRIRGLEWKYDESISGKGMDSCIVKIDENHWQQIEKYKKTGIIRNINN